MDELRSRIARERSRIDTRLRDRENVKDRWPLEDTDAQELETIAALLKDIDAVLSTPTLPQE